MKKLNQLIKFLLFSFVLFLPTVSVNAQFQGSYALLVAATDTGNKAEKKIIERLKGMGFEATIVKQDAASDADANTNDLVIVSASVTSSTIVSKMPGLPTAVKPVIMCETSLYDFMGYQAKDGVEVQSSQSLKIVKKHQLSANIPLGEIKINSVAKSYSTGKPEGKPTIIATTITDSTQATIFAYDTDDSMATTKAPERRMGFFIFDSAADSSMNESGWKLFEAAIYWSMHQYTLGIKTNKSADNISNYPNPFSLKTDISFNVQSESFVRLSVYNMLGKQITTLMEGVKSSGDYVVTFNPSDIPGGVYIYKLEIGSNVVSKKMIYVK